MTMQDNNKIKQFDEIIKSNFYITVNGNDIQLIGNSNRISESSALWELWEYTNCHAGRANRHLGDLKVAIEHESSKRDWMDKVGKIVYVRCPLKVIIGYNYCDMRGREELDKLD